MAYPREETTERGYPFWDTHEARVLLANDVRKGTSDKMFPKELWESRDEYLCFPLEVFRDHNYQERRKQREEPGWVLKRNNRSKKNREKEVAAMRDEWDTKQHKSHMKEIEHMLQRWEAASHDSSESENED